MRIGMVGTGVEHDGGRAAVMLIPCHASVSIV
jgi:hypothetical protein